MVAPAKLAGIAKTANGWCVIEVEVSPDGQLTQLKLHESERYPQFPVARSKDLQRRLALDAQRDTGLPKAALGVQKLDTRGRNWSA
jgi:hypothetical protein